MAENKQTIPPHATAEMGKLIIDVETGKVSRRQVRYLLFRIRDDDDRLHEFDKGLKAFIELQFKPGMNWQNFTFTWDVSATKYLKVITPFEWESSGGRMKDGFCEPAAFTNQEM